MQDSQYHFFKFKLELGKLGFLYLITFFFCSFLIYLFRFYTSVTLLSAPFTSFFIIPTLLFLLYIFFLLPSVFYFFFSISFLSVALCPSIFYHAFLYIPYSFFLISFAVSFHPSFSFVPSFFSFRSYLFFIYVLLILFSVLSLTPSWFSLFYLPLCFVLTFSTQFNIVCVTTGHRKCP